MDGVGHPFYAVPLRIRKREERIAENNAVIQQYSHQMHSGKAGAVQSDSA